MHCKVRQLLATKMALWPIERKSRAPYRQNNSNTSVAPAVRASMYLISLGLKVPHPDHVEPRHFTQLIEQVKGRPDSAAITMAMLRSLTHAEYSPANVGHFGLALESYAHFTSPIRRYPDLLVHRAIRHIVRGGKPGKYAYSPKEMERLGAITSAHEKRAEDATRDVEAWLKCQYMQGHLGDEFDGVVTGVTNFGVFVQITDLMTDGLVHVYSIVSTDDEWDRYEGLQWLASERYVREHPDDSDNQELLDKMHAARNRYLRWGREELGWATYLFLKP